MGDVTMHATHPLLHPFSSPAKPEREFIEVVAAQGCRLRDSDGNEYIDALASLWYCQVGHGRRDMHDAISAQLLALDAYSTFDPFSNPVASRLAEMIVERSPHPDGRVFFGSSGSEAADTALKIVRLVQRARDHAERQVFITRTHGYHGTNFGGTSAQGIAPNREGWGDLVPHFLETPHDDIEHLATLFASHGERVAGVIVEPVQGAGGVHMPPDHYLASVRRLCDDHGALLIFDEVICGFGRTGNWFGADTFDVVPDVITFAKGVTSGYLPLSGVILARPLCDTLEAMGEMLRTGYTYSGHPTCCAAAIKNIEIIESEGLIERAGHIGDRIEAGLAAMHRDGLIESHRGVGALRAADLGHDAADARAELLRRGVVVRALGTALALCPPLVITDDELDIVLDTMHATLATAGGV